VAPASLGTSDRGRVSGCRSHEPDGVGRRSVRPVAVPSDVKVWLEGLQARDDEPARRPPGVDQLLAGQPRPPEDGALWHGDLHEWRGPCAGRTRPRFRPRSLVHPAMHGSIECQARRRCAGAAVAVVGLGLGARRAPGVASAPSMHGAAAAGRIVGCVDRTARPHPPRCGPSPYGAPNRVSTLGRVRVVLSGNPAPREPGSVPDEGRNVDFTCDATASSAAARRGPGSPGRLPTCEVRLSASPASG